MARTSQRGYVLLALLLVLLVTGSSILLGGFNNRQQLINSRQTETLYQLMQAKEALLAFAANSASLYDNERGPGYLPCPDFDGMDNNNAADGICDSDTPVIGRLPDFIDTGTTRFTISREQRDADNRLWYVVAPRHVHHSDNEEGRRGIWRSSAGSPELDLRLNLDGNSNYVALLIAPGEALDSQTRSGNGNDPAAYLESADPDSALDYYSFSPDPADLQPYNDLVLGITHDEYMQMLGAVVTGMVRDQVVQHFDSTGTYPASLDFLATSGPGWTGDEDWIDSVLEFVPVSPPLTPAFDLGFAGCAYVFSMTPSGFSMGGSSC